MLCLGFSGCFLACARCQPHYALGHQFRFYARYLWFQETLHTKGSHLQWHREGCTHLSPIAINKIHPQNFWLIKKVQAFTRKWIFHKVNLSPGCWLCRWNTSAEHLSTVISVWSMCHWWQFLPLIFFSKYKSYHQSRSSFLMHLCWDFL